MNPLRAFAAFIYDFVIGDDPMIAAAVVVALGLTALLSSAGLAAWWVLPLAVATVLALSVRRGMR